MKARNPDFREQVKQVFNGAPFIRTLGIELVDVGPGWCHSRVAIRDDLHQQHGFVHAGVQATIADHTGGAAAGSLVAADQTILSVEFKINLLRPALASVIECRAQVVKAGRRLSIVESRVWADDAESGLLVSQAQLTMAVISASDVGGHA